MHLSALYFSAKVKQYLRDKLAAQNSAITLAHIASLEKKLSEHFHVKDFLSLEKGSFLEFLVNNIQVVLSFLIYFNSANRRYGSKLTKQNNLLS